MTVQKTALSRRRGMVFRPNGTARPLDPAAQIRHTSTNPVGGHPMYFLKRLLTWWNSQTIGTQIFTARRGQKVGDQRRLNLR